MKALALNLLKHLGLAILAYALYQGLNMWVIYNNPSYVQSPQDYWAPVGGFVIYYVGWATYQIYKYMKSTRVSK